MDVSAQRPSVSIGLDEHGVEAALGQRPSARVTFVELRRVTAFESVPAGRQIEVGEAEENVEVVGHQEVREDTTAEAGGDPVEEAEPLVAIVVCDDVAAINTAIGDVEQAADQFDSQATRHEQVLWSSEAVEPDP